MGGRGDLLLLVVKIAGWLVDYAYSKTTKENVCIFEGGAYLSECLIK